MLVGSAWPYPYLRLMNVPQRLAYLVMNCALAAWSYSLGESVNTAIWGELSVSRYTDICLSRSQGFHLLFFLVFETKDCRSTRNCSDHRANVLLLLFLHFLCASVHVDLLVLAGCRSLVPVSHSLQLRMFLSKNVSCQMFPLLMFVVAECCSLFTKVCFCSAGKAQRIA